MINSVMNNFNKFPINSAKSVSFGSRNYSADYAKKSDRDNSNHSSGINKKALIGAALVAVPILIATFMSRKKNEISTLINSLKMNPKEQQLTSKEFQKATDLYDVVNFEKYQIFRNEPQNQDFRDILYCFLSEKTSGKDERCYNILFFRRDKKNELNINAFKRIVASVLNINQTGVEYEGSINTFMEKLNSLQPDKKKERLLLEIQNEEGLFSELIKILNKDVKTSEDENIIKSFKSFMTNLGSKKISLFTSNVSLYEECLRRLELKPWSKGFPKIRKYYNMLPSKFDLIDDAIKSNIGMKVFDEAV